MVKSTKFPEFDNEEDNQIIIDETPFDIQRPISPEEKEIQDAYMIESVRSFNQYVRYMFKNTKGIDIMPTYAHYNSKTRTVSVHHRTDWLKMKQAKQMGFVDYLKKKAGGGGQPVYSKPRGQKKWEIAKKIIEQGFADPTKDKPKWWDDEYRQFLEATKDDTKYDKIKDEGIPILHLDDVYEYKQIKYEDAKGKMQDDMFKWAFTQPMKSNDVLELLDPKNDKMIWGDNNMKVYQEENDVNTKKYRQVMRKLVKEYFKSFNNIDFSVYTIDDSTDREEAISFLQTDVENVYEKFNYSLEFPNIERIRKWFEKYGFSNNQSHHKYTEEKFMSLKSNTQRANFIDGAVFIIANAIYMEQGGDDRKSSVENARNSRGRPRDLDKRTKDWRKDNKIIATNMLRKINRSAGKDNRAQTTRGDPRINQSSRKDRRSRR